MAQSKLIISILVAAKRGLQTIRRPGEARKVRRIQRKLRSWQWWQRPNDTTPGIPAGDARATVVADLSSRASERVIEAQIELISHLMSDEWKAFMSIGESFAEHETVKHSSGEYVRDAVHVNSAEGFNSRVRRTIAGVFHHISPQHADLYFYEVGVRWLQRIVIANDIRGLLRNFGVKVGLVGKIKFDERINELVEDRPDLREEFTKLHKKVWDLVREDEVCRRLTTIPGAGPGVALTYTATIDIPGRFAHSKAVGSALGLTPKLNESGESKRGGRVSCCGDMMMRSLL